MRITLINLNSRSYFLAESSRDNDKTKQERTIQRKGCIVDRELVNGLRTWGDKVETKQETTNEGKGLRCVLQTFKMRVREKAGQENHVMLDNQERLYKKKLYAFHQMPHKKTLPADFCRLNAALSLKAGLGRGRRFAALSQAWSLWVPSWRVAIGQAQIFMCSSWSGMNKRNSMMAPNPHLKWAWIRTRCPHSAPYLVRLNHYLTFSNLKYLCQVQNLDQYGLAFLILFILRSSSEILGESVKQEYDKLNYFYFSHNHVALDRQTFSFRVRGYTFINEDNLCPCQYRPTVCMNKFPELDHLLSRPQMIICFRALTTAKCLTEMSDLWAGGDVGVKDELSRVSDC